MFQLHDWTSDKLNLREVERQMEAEELENESGWVPRLPVPVVPGDRDHRGHSGRRRGLAYAWVLGPGMLVDVWDTTTGKRILEIPADGRKLDERAGAVDTVASRDGTAVYIGWTDGTVDALALPSAELRTLGHHPVAVRVVDESPVGGMISTLDDDGRTLI